MSDLYDSLEDEVEDNKFSLDAQNSRSSRSSGTVRVDRRQTPENYSFFLNDSHFKVNILPVFHNWECEKEFFLPQIETKPKVSRIIVDNEVLNEQGLQLNEDGSITRSPRQEEDVLPFITREYRNLQFQKRKTYSINNDIINSSNAPARSNFKKNSFTCSDNCQFINMRKKKGSSEVFFGRENKLVKSTQRSRQSDSNQCLVKEPEDLRRNRNFKKVKGEIIFRRKRNDEINFENSPNDRKHELNDSKRPKKFELKSFLPNTTRTKLNYSEQQQLKKGFNPIHLRPERKKFISDSNRSNFGDSVMEELPEISSRVMSCDNLRDENEEIFYKKIMQRDRILRETQQSSRSDGLVERLNLNRTPGPNSCKGWTAFVSRRSSCRNKQKSMFIDLPVQSDHSELTSKKTSHYCSVNSSKNLSKIELAIKAKTYGYLVNARNIFKFKSQSDRKSNAEREDKLDIQKQGLSDRAYEGPKLLKQNSLPVNSFPRINPPQVPFLPRASASQCVAEVVERGEKGCFLPQVRATGSKDSKINAKMFERINYCLRTE